MNKYQITYLQGTPSTIIEAANEHEAAVEALARYRKTRTFVDLLPLSKIVLDVKLVQD